MKKAWTKVDDIQKSKIEEMFNCCGLDAEDKQRTCIGDNLNKPRCYNKIGEYIPSTCIGDNLDKPRCYNKIGKYLYRRQPQQTAVLQQNR